MLDRHFLPLAKIAIVVALILDILGCAAKPSIVGKYEDKNWQVQTRVDRWEFRSDGTWHHKTFFSERLSTEVRGKYEFDGKVLKLTHANFLSYKQDGSLRYDKKPIDGHILTPIGFARDGDKIILDPENKTVEGKTVLIPAK